MDFGRSKKTLESESTYPLGRLRKTSASEKNYSILYLTNCTNVLEFVYFDFVYPP